jgi:hypothetical protein
MSARVGTVTMGLLLAGAAYLGAQAPGMPANLVARDEHLAELAIESASRRGVESIPLRSGDRIAGAVYDQFFLGVAVARAAALSGTPMDASALTNSPQWRSRRMVIVAYPTDCEGKPDKPLAVRYVPSASLPFRPAEPPPPVRGNAAGDLLPGVKLAEDALVAPVVVLPLIGAKIEIDYEAPYCHGAATTASFGVTTIPGSGARGLNALKLPEGAIDPSPSTVRVEGLLDLDGHPRFMTHAQGPESLAPTAMSALGSGHFTPSTSNGVPTPLWAMMPVVFTATGAPGAVAPYAPPASMGPGFTMTDRIAVPSSRPAPPATAPGRSDGPAPMASSTVNGRLSHDTVTPDVPGLDASTSKCGVSTDDGYGLTAATPVKVGGGIAAGPAREQQYMATLRGPAGQGLRFVRLGSTMGPDQIILDLYEVSYAGLAKAVRIFVDEYRTETLQAPRGFTCAAPFDIK